ncbi:hypothetical protein [Caldalkalibacillus mannanilyticus]|uniref:hypothetical protein n=1 Tax=Caldalkalibacillus mannanilyticus TaxID=1418 RepID=UPI0011DC7F74|nr:hypothetical protein [Caldalkalibacillus mannanilyticus]
MNLSIIDQITIRGIVGKPDLILEKDKAEEFLRFLKNASFDQSNRRGFGPTPEIIIELKYKDGTYLNLTTVQGILFEIQPIHIDSDSQFVIESEDLGEWLQVFREGK